MQAPTVREVRLLYIALAFSMVAIAVFGGIGFVHIARQPDALATTIRAQNDQLDQQASEIRALRRQLDSQAASFRHQQALSRQQANHVAAVQRFQNNILIRALRHAGIPVPKAALLSGGGGHPKAPAGRPRHHSPGTPGVTGHTPSLDSMLCQLVPALCGLPLGLPPLLP